MLLSCILLFTLWLVWFSLRYAWWAVPVDYSCPRILMYHMISEAIPGATFNGLRVAPEMFERQLEWLSREGWHFVTMNELVNSPESMPEKTVAITLDDGYEDNYTTALPLLEKYNAKATVYLVIDRHDNDWSTSKKAHHNSGELAREKKLSDQQVKEMLESGRIEIGGHTKTHVNLARANEEDKKLEIFTAKEMLEAQYNTQVSSFAYPFGIYTAVDPHLVEKAGYSNAVLAAGGVETNVANNKLLLRRVKISGKDNFYAFKLRMKIGRRGWKK